MYRLYVPALTALALPALAQDYYYEDGSTDGGYITVQGGVSQPDNHSYSDVLGQKIETELKDGYVLVGAIGSKTGNIRVEAEASYRNNDVESHKAGLFPLQSPQGKAQVIAGMANAYLDIPTGSAITPYVGAGAGLANVKFKDYDCAVGCPLLDEDGGNAFAYQGIAGVNMALNNYLSFNLEYRYFATDDVKVRAGAYESETSYETNNFLVGARMAF